MNGPEKPRSVTLPGFFIFSTVRDALWAGHNSPLALAVLHAGAFADPPNLFDGRFVTVDGMTLYTFDKDTTPGVSACTGGCMSNWPAATAAPTDKPSGATGR
ncbi:putative lipoprotein with Yx(FWY)xxD motif [Paraburkholderia sp. WSM4177]|nr:putative lipoprotein with Yx(FWY)xxD motif [Paraburkholderia sp. WSM4177]MBB5487794.1 putative lipoprotein with Yx(FWY)xxD motif [Paraburkholderia sp. WSM4180]